MVQSVGIDFHGGLHQARCLDERAQLCDGFSFLSSRDQGLCLGRLWGVARKRGRTQTIQSGKHHGQVLSELRRTF